MKRIISQLDEIKHKSSLYSLNRMRIKPLAIAVYSVLAGMSLTPSAADTTIPSPATISATVTLQNGNNMVADPFSTTSPATLTITSSGVLNYPDADTWLFCGRMVHTGAIDGNNITSYGTINGSTSPSAYLHGGYFAYSGITGLGAIQVNNNTVSLKAGSSTSNVKVYGGYVSVTAQDHVTASGNTVFIEYGSEFSGNVYVIGGYAVGDGEATASNNKVILGAGSYTGIVYGGYAGSFYPSLNATVTGNTVYLYGDADVSSADIWGGRSNLLGLSPVLVDFTLDLSGNTLVFGYNNQAWAPSNYTIGKVQNFSTIRFDNATWGKTITINSFANHSTDSSVTKVDASKVAFSGVDSLSSGDSYDMLTIEALDTGSLGLTSENSAFTIGSTLEGTGKVSLSEDGKTVTYTADQIRASAQSHSAAMAMSAGTVALNQGADTTSAAGFNLANSGITGVQSFSSVGGGAARVETGSFVSLKTLNFSVGIGNNIQNDYGLLSIGGAFEAGYGKFKNHFDAGTADPYIKKTGHVSFYGLALLSNLTFENLWHVNGAVRVGRMESTQNNALYNAATSETYNINIGTNYYGLELGGGKLVKIDDSNSVDIYGKYFYLYQDSDTFNAGGKYKLSAVNSHRLRVAGRYSHDFTPVTSLYGGLGLEHEFDGKSKLKVDDKAWAKSSKTKGTRAFGEIGVAVKPASNTGLILDFSVKGLYGDNFRGAWASADIKYMF